MIKFFGLCVLWMNVAVAVRFTLHGHILDFAEFDSVNQTVTSPHLGVADKQAILARAANLNIRLPTSYRVAVCPYALIRHTTVVCNYHNHSMQMLDKDLAVAYDFPGEHASPVGCTLRDRKQVPDHLQ